MNNKRSNPWPRRSSKATIYGLIIGCLFGYGFAWNFSAELSECGYINIGKGIGGYIDVYGDEAKGAILALIIAGTTCLILAIALHLRLSFLIKNKLIKEDQEPPQKHVVCPECEEAFRGIDLPDLICPKCKKKVVNLKEYYSAGKEPLKKKAIKRIQQNQ